MAFVPSRSVYEPVVKKLSAQVKKAFDLLDKRTYNPASLTGWGLAPVGKLCKMPSSFAPEAERSTASALLDIVNT
jgi:hypothetical protein